MEEEDTGRWINTCLPSINFNMPTASPLCPADAPGLVENKSPRTVYKFRPTDEAIYPGIANHNCGAVLCGEKMGEGRRLNLSFTSSSRKPGHYKHPSHGTYPGTARPAERPTQCNGAIRHGSRCGPVATGCRLRLVARTIGARVATITRHRQKSSHHGRTLTYSSAGSPRPGEPQFGRIRHLVGPFSRFREFAGRTVRSGWEESSKPTTSPSENKPTCPTMQVGHLRQRVMFLRKSAHL